MSKTRISYILFWAFETECLQFIYKSTHGMSNDFLMVLGGSKVNGSNLQLLNVYVKKI